MIINLYKSPSKKFSKRLVNIKYSQLILNDLIKLDNVHKLEHKHQYLVNSYYINLMALWQTFIEELLSDSVHHLIEISNQDVGRILKFNLETRLKRMSNPNSQNIEDNLKFLVGYEKALDDLPHNLKAKEKINKILKTRHKIAHTGISDKNLTIESNFKTMEYLLDISEKLEELVFIKINKNYR